MDSLDVSKFKRVSKEEGLTWFNIKDGITYTNKDISIIFPSNYVKKGLCTMNTNTELLCIFAIVDYYKKEYAITLAPVIHKFNAIRINEVAIEDVPHMELKFSKGDIVLPSEHTLVSDDFIFTLFDLFFINGKIPWFLDYEDLASLLEGARKFAGSAVGDNPIGPHILSSLVARYNKNEKLYFRSVLETREDMKKIGKPSYTGLNNPYLSFGNTTARIIGSRLEDGIIASVLNPTNEMQKLDKIIVK